MALEWDAIHLTAQCKCDGYICKGFTCGQDLSGYIYRMQQQRVSCDCKLSTSRLIMAYEVSVKTAARGGRGEVATVRLMREKHRARQRCWSFVLPPTLSISLLASLLLFSNKPSFSLLLACLFVCVTSIQNNIIIRFCLKPPFLFYSPSPPPLPHLLILGRLG